MTTPSPNTHARPAFSTGSWLMIALPLVVLAALFHERWLPMVRLSSPDATAGKAEHAHEEHPHEEHGSENSLELSEQARKNIGLKLTKVELGAYTRYLTVPGIVVERPGRSIRQVTAPITGIITGIYPTDGQTVLPGQKLFDIRMTDEDLVQVQADLLRTAEELDVIGREISRLEKLTVEGGLAGKTLLERKYEAQKQEAALRSLRQALVLHGLSSEQVETILKERVLLQSLTVFAPPLAEEMRADAFYQVRELKTTQGQQVTAGEPLAVLVDHSELFIEGNAFEREIPQIHQVAQRNEPIQVLLETEGARPLSLESLHILYIAPQIDSAARTLHFYVSIPNHLEQDRTLPDGRRYSAWRYRPGQRTQILLPLETWREKIVLPVDAVVEDGVEMYVFTPNGDHLERRTVHVEFKDQQAVVIANDGVLFPGEQVVIAGAKQLLLALKNKSGGAVDPHAGHSH